MFSLLNVYFSGLLATSVAGILLIHLTQVNGNDIPASKKWDFRMISQYRRELKYCKESLESGQINEQPYVDFGVENNIPKLVEYFRDFEQIGAASKHIRQYMVCSLKTVMSYKKLRPRTFALILSEIHVRFQALWHGLNFVNCVDMSKTLNLEQPLVDSCKEIAVQLLSFSVLSLECIIQNLINSMADTKKTHQLEEICDEPQPKSGKPASSSIFLKCCVSMPKVEEEHEVVKHVSKHISDVVTRAEEVLEDFHLLVNILMDQYMPRLLDRSLIKSTQREPEDFYGHLQRVMNNVALNTKKNIQKLFEGIRQRIPDTAVTEMESITSVTPPFDVAQKLWARAPEVVEEFLMQDEDTEKLRKEHDIPKALVVLELNFLEESGTVLKNDLDGVINYDYDPFDGGVDMVADKIEVW